MAAHAAMRLAEPPPAAQLAARTGCQRHNLKNEFNGTQASAAMEEAFGVHRALSMPRSLTESTFIIKRCMENLP